MPSWPGSLDPYPLNETYAHSFGDARQKNAVEQGPARQRRIYSKALVKIDIEWMFLPAEFETFYGFYDQTLDDGVIAFDFPVFTGSAYETISVNFVKGSMKPRRAEGQWKVSATLECDALPVMSSGALDAIIGAAPGGGALPDWPADFVPNPLERDFDVTLPDPTIRSDFEDGYLPQSRKFKSAPAVMAVTWPMANAQYDAFRAWLSYRVFGGEGWFTIPVFRGGSYETRPARFVQGSLKATREGEDWLVHSKLELRDLPSLAGAVPSAILGHIGIRILGAPGAAILGSLS